MDKIMTDKCRIHGPRAQYVHSTIARGWLCRGCVEDGLYREDIRAEIKAVVEEPVVCTCFYCAETEECPRGDLRLGHDPGTHVCEACGDKIADKIIDDLINGRD